MNQTNINKFRGNQKHNFTSKFYEHKHESQTLNLYYTITFYNTIYNYY